MRLELIAQLPITTDTETTARAWRAILALARAEGLTTYDATYLELAIGRGLPLQTKDEALITRSRAKRRGSSRLILRDDPRCCAEGLPGVRLHGEPRSLIPNIANGQDVRELLPWQKWAPRTPCLRFYCDAR